MKLCVQMYTLRDAAANDLDGTLNALADMGIRWVELAGTYGLPPEDLRAILDKYGLAVCGSHIGLQRLEEDLDGVIAEQNTLGNPNVVLPWVGPADYAEGWDALARRVTPIAEKLLKAGLSFSYHNHNFEFAMQGEQTGYDVFFATAPAETVLAEIDVYWVMFAGYDPAEYIRKYAGRQNIVHWKDGKKGEKPAFTAGGEGDVPWDEVIEASKLCGAEWGTVEIDVPPGDPIDDVRKSVEFFVSKGIEL